MKNMMKLRTDVSDQQINQAIKETTNAILLGGAKRATKFLSVKDTVKATLQGKYDSRARQTTILVTVGRPNYNEQEFIDQCREVNKPFPIRKLKIQWSRKRRG
jgi:hypothetical protein